MKHYNKKRKLTLKESAFLESYADYLIKESYRRVLNENEILALIAYTEGFFGKTFRVAAGLPYVTADSSNPLAPGIQKTRELGRNAKNNAERVGNKIDAAIYNTVLQPAGQKIKSLAQKHIVDPMSKKWDDAKNYADRKLSDFGSWLVDPKTYKGAATGVYNKVNNLVNSTPNVGMWNGQKYIFDNQGNPISPVVQGNFQVPPQQQNQVAASESYIRRNGRKVKQKPIMSDFQEQMLIDYLKYQKKKTKRKK